MLARRSLVCIFFLLTALQLHAQVRVDLKFSRRLFLAYEPVMASVSITNFSGRDITLENSESQNWLSFEITNSEGTLVSPRPGKCRFDPRTLVAGETCRFAVNLVTSYPITEFGAYRVRASIYFDSMSKYFSSPLRNIEVSEGKVVWEQTLGVPEGEPGAGSQRQVSLLTFRNEDANELYARIEDREEGVVYGTQKVGKLITQELPQIEVDPNNKIHLMQVVSPKIYLYSCIGLNGEAIQHATYYQVKSIPKLRRLPNGNVGVAGGQVAAAPNGQDESVPKAKISDRPVVLPKE